MKEAHALERTSPKGGPFFGTCIKCGAKGLRLPFDKPECTNPANLSQDDTMIMAIKGPDHD